MTIISYSKKFIFIHIPKCGGTSIEEEWERFAAPGDLVVKFENSVHGKGVQRGFTISQHDTLRALSNNVRIADFAKFETCATVRHPLRVVESYYKYGRRHLDSAARGALMHVPEQRRSYDEWVDFVRAKLASGDTSAAPQFVLTLAGGAILESMLSSSFEDYLERVTDQRWANYVRGYLTIDGAVAVQTILRLEEPIAVRKYFKSRYYSAFTLLHTNKSQAPTDMIWSKAMRQKFNDITADEHQALGYDIIG